MPRSRSSVVAADVEKQLIGVWTLASFYSESRATGEKTAFYGERPNGYTIFTPEKRMMVMLTAEHRKKPDSDEDCIVPSGRCLRTAGFIASRAINSSRRLISPGTKR